MILRSAGEDGLSRVAFLVMNETLSPWSDDVFDMVITDDLDSNCRVKSGFHVVDIHTCARLEWSGLHIHMTSIHSMSVIIPSHQLSSFVPEDSALGPLAVAQ
jgi:hypothetical protein